MPQMKAQASIIYDASAEDTARCHDTTALLAGLSTWEKP